ncbi:thiamine-phosphate kinase [Acanthopleuribacter pedis]|uniref:Thiamine-monophosphate kinase n=1 Tax=Acanthopleuribacter pedis TaxID=442870 RepID=A0A8J7U3B6_9BACT|nr:thiamine-phosphate kinase [Acanthopleuribacter pedis]MBO1320223.1 thiamine-phosphate kinase [Acanthopleuribacter pedis]
MSEFVKDWEEDQLIRQVIAPVAADLSNDTAVLHPQAGHDLLISSDALVEDVHFLRRAPAAWVGQKAVRVNASDIAADGGSPRWITLSLSLPPDLPVRWVREFMTGVAAACSELGITLVGGDTTRAPQHIAISITVLGDIPHGTAITRSGAEPGHLIAVTGPLGDSFLGLGVMLQQTETPADTHKRLLQRHFMPPDRGPFARAAAVKRLVSAMMDLSDGPATDLPRLCRASGVGARIDLEHLPRSNDGIKYLDPLMLPGCGEDFELLLTCPPVHREALVALATEKHTPLHFIGRCTQEPGVAWRLQGRTVTPAVGWHHFSKSSPKTNTDR